MSSQLTFALVIATSVMVAMSSVPVNAGPKMTDLILDACERKGGPNSEDYEKMRTMIKSGEEGIEDPDELLMSATPLMVAAMVMPEPSIPLMKFLIEELGADTATTHSEGGTLMDVLVGEDHAHVEAAKFISNEIGHHRLARHPKDPNDKVNILHKLAAVHDFDRKGHGELFDHLLDHIPVDTKTGEYHKFAGSTALHEAARKNNHKAIERLLDAGADINAVDDEGNTVLHHMAHYMEDEKFIEGINMLLDAGAAIDVQNYDGDYPLDIAKRYKDNYHRYKAHFPAMDLLGFSDPDFNESHEDDMLKMELDAMIDPENLPHFPERPLLSMD